jgi:hypothetical protein
MVKTPSFVIICCNSRIMFVYSSFVIQIVAESDADVDAVDAVGLRTVTGDGVVVVKGVVGEVVLGVVVGCCCCRVIV